MDIKRTFSKHGYKMNQSFCVVAFFQIVIYMIVKRVNLENSLQKRVSSISSMFLLLFLISILVHWTFSDFNKNGFSQTYTFAFVESIHINGSTN